MLGVYRLWSAFCRLLLLGLPLAGTTFLIGFDGIIWAQGSQGIRSIAALNKSSVPITAIAFSPDGHQLLCGSTNGVQWLIWPELKVTGNSNLSQLNTGLTNVLDFQFSPTGDRLLISGGTPGEVGQVEIWDWKRDSNANAEGNAEGNFSEASAIERMTDLIIATRLQTLSFHDDMIYQSAWSESEQYIAAASFDGLCTVYDLPQKKVVSRFNGHSKGVLTLQFWNSETWLSGGLDHSIRMWHSNDGTVQRTMNNHVGIVIQILSESSTVNPRTRRLVSISQDKTVRLWQPEIGRMVRLERLSSVPTAACWDSASCSIIVGCEDGVVYRLNDETLAIESQVKLSGMSIEAVAVNPLTGETVLAGSGGLRILDAEYLR